MRDATVAENTSIGVWLHGESLSPTDPAVLANPDAPRVFVFDQPLLAAKSYSFKRLFFLYECAVEAVGDAGELRRGRIAEEVLAFCTERGLTTLHATHAPSDNPRFQAIVRDLRAAGLRVVLHEQEALAEPPRNAGKAGFDRFSKFWHAIEEEALEPKSDKNLTPSPFPTKEGV